MHLSPQELERYAFMAGDGLVASLAETVNSLEQENTCYVTEQERLKAQAFEAGRLEGLGEDVQALITDLTAQVASLTDQLGMAGELLGSCHAWLQGDQARTAKGRRESAFALANRMVVHGLGYPQH
ncbi:hypothetical protein DT070_00050 [Polaromonas sp. SP1]|nr:hypothetical protein DT070_00050 [Polaromonas sp. SP1]